MEFGWNTGTLIGVLVAFVVYVYMTFAVDRRLTYVTTVYMHRSVAHNALRLRRILMLWCDYTMNRVGLWIRGWVVCHRDHHANTDQAKDPHSPWNLLDDSISDADERRRVAVQKLLKVNKQLYQEVAYDRAYVTKHKAPIRTTWLDGWGRRLGAATFVWYHLTHWLGYLFIGWLASMLLALLPGSFSMNFSVYAILTFGLAIVSCVHGGIRYKNHSAQVNAYGHAWPTRSKNKAVGHASDHGPTAIVTAGEGNQAYHHEFQMSARLRDPKRTTPSHDKGYLVVWLLGKLRLAYDIKVETRPSTEPRQLNDDLSWPNPDLVAV